MNKRRPYIVTFIGDIFLLGSVLSIITVVFPDFLAKIGFRRVPTPIFSDGIVSVLLPIVALIASFGFLKMKMWGYWLIVIYCVFFLVMYIVGCLQNSQLYLSLNFTYMVIEMIFILPTRKYFQNRIPSS